MQLDFYSLVHHTRCSVFSLFCTGPGEATHQIFFHFCFTYCPLRSLQIFYFTFSKKFWDTSILCITVIITIVIKIIQNLCLEFQLQNICNTVYRRNMACLRHTIINIFHKNNNFLLDSKLPFLQGISQSVPCWILAVLQKFSVFKFTSAINNCLS